MDSCDEEEVLSDESSSDLENTFGNDKNIGQVIGRPMHVEHPGISAPVGSNFSAEKKAKLIAEKEKAELRLRKMEEDLDEEEEDEKKKVGRSSNLIRKRRRKSTQKNDDGDPSLKDLSSLWSDLNDETSETNEKNSPKNIKRKRKDVNYEEELDSELEEESDEEEKNNSQKSKNNNNRKRERCWLCTFSTHPLAKQVSSYVSASVSSVDTFHMASQIKVIFLFFIVFLSLNFLTYIYKKTE